jgi:hypothetical protein
MKTVLLILTLALGTAPVVAKTTRQPHQAAQAERTKARPAPGKQHSKTTPPQREHGNVKPQADKQPKKPKH